MDSDSEQRLAELAVNSPKEFLDQLLSAEGLDKDADGRRSLAATLENHLYYDKPYINGAFTFNRMVRDGGGEGEGESVYRVYSVARNGEVITYFSVCGYYSSDYGTTWDDDFTTVYPRQVVVTQYFTEKE